jgi:hypothetical protein
MGLQLRAEDFESVAVEMEPAVGIEPTTNGLQSR